MRSKLILSVIFLYFLITTATTYTKHESGAAWKSGDRQNVVMECDKLKMLVEDEVTSLIKILQEQEKENSCSHEDRKSGKNGKCLNSSLIPVEPHDIDSLTVRTENMQILLLVLLQSKLIPFPYFSQFAANQSEI